METSNLTREIRVFLSSTFRDMEAERTHLIKKVFPKVRTACQERQVGFTEIDLRWGITEEESKNGATVEICLKEIDRCRDFPPFFIGFLGERYGWIPKHEELEAYWGKHQDSAYERLIHDAVEEEISVTELEMRLAVLNAGAAEKTQGHALFLLRDPKLTDRLYTEQTGKQPDPSDKLFFDAGGGKLEAIKDKIRNSPFFGCDGYQEIEEFGNAIEGYLLGQLDLYFPAEKIPSELERSNEAHAAFRYHRLEGCLPRPDFRDNVIAALKLRTQTPSLGPILISAPSGQGKSAFMADLARHLEAHHPEYKVIDHYIGADGNNDLDDWIHRLLQIVHPAIQDEYEAIPDNPKERQEILKTWLATAAARQKLRYVLILDALDQLRDNGTDLQLLQPDIIGPAATVICSAVEGSQGSQAAAKFEIIKLPPLTIELRAQLIVQTLQRYRKALDESLVAQLAEVPQSGIPLFLVLAVEELRLDARFETLKEVVGKIARQPDAQHLFLEHFLLDPDNSRPEQPALAAAFMAMLGASYQGLAEAELRELLAQPDDPLEHEDGKRRLPQVHLSRLLANFRPFLLNKSGNRAPMHRILGEAAMQYEGPTKIRRHLYAHFAPGYGNGFGDITYNDRDAAEALYQMAQLSKEAKEEDTAATIAQLKADLSRLGMVSELHLTAPDILLDALRVIGFDEITALAERWAGQIRFDNEMQLKEYGPAVTDFAVWVRKWAGHYSVAQKLQKGMLDAMRSLLNDGHPDMLTVMGNLAVTLSAQDDLAGARALEVRVLEARRRTAGEEDLGTLTAMGNLAQTLGGMGDLAGARALQEKALTAFTRILGEKDLYTLTAMNNLAATLNKLSDMSGARTLQEQVLKAYARIFGEDHPDTLMAMNNLANTLNMQGDLSRARTLQEQVLEVRRRILGEEHTATLGAIGNLAATLSRLGDWARARALEEQVLEARRRTRGEGHQDTLIAMGNLANTLNKQGDLPGARTLQEQVLETRRTLSETDPDTLLAIEILAATLVAAGDFEEALKRYTQLLRLRTAQLGKSDQDTIETKGCIARCLREAGKLDESLKAFNEVIAESKAALESGHEVTIMAESGLAALYCKLGDHAMSRRILEAAIKESSASLGTEDELTMRLMSDLDTCKKEH